MLGFILPSVFGAPLAPALALTSLWAVAAAEAPPPPPPPAPSLIARTATTSSIAISAEWLELRTSSTASTASTAPALVAPELPKEGHLRIVYTGGAGGIGSGRYDFGVSRRLTREIAKADGELIGATPYHGVAGRGVHVVITEDRRVASLVTFFARGPILCGPPAEARSIRTPTTRMLVDGTDVPAAIRALPGELVITRYHKRRCVSPDGTVAFVFGPENKPLALDALKLGDFEIRLGLHLLARFGPEPTPPTHVEVVGVPADDAARRFRALRSITGAPDVLYVDAGGFVDGASSILDGQLSLHRPLGLEMLAKLKPAALAVGDTELAGGAANLLRELRSYGLPYVATNWDAKDEALELPTVITTTITTEIGPARIAFLGAIDPAIALGVPQLAAEGVTLTEPVAALDAEVHRLQNSPDPPDLIVVLTSARWQIYEAIQSEVRGIDLVIGETSPIENRMRSTELTLRPSTARHRLSAAIAPIIGVAVTELDVERAKNGRLMLRKVAIEPHRLIESLEPDPEIMARVTETRARTYPELDRPLVKPPGKPTDPLSKDLWARVVCETIRKRTGADVVLLPELPRLVDVLGPQTELLALNGLVGFDKLERHVILGSKLADLLRDAPDVTPIGCGGQIGVRGPKVLGRDIDAARTYVVVSTDRARANGLGALLAGTYGARILDSREVRPILGDDGQPLSLRNAVIDTLRARREAAGTETAPVEDLLVTSETTKTNLALLRVNRLSLSASGFVGTDDPLPAVKETRASAPSSLTLGLDTDLALIFDFTSVTAELRGLGRYARIAAQSADDATPDPDPVEQADDLRFSAAITLPVLRVTTGPVAFNPYTEVSFDTEFTPAVEDADRQAALFFTGGLSLTGIPTVTLFRVGASVGRDLSLEPPWAFSLRTEIESNIAFGYDLALKLRAVGDWFAPTDGDTDANLRFGYTFEGRLALPLARWLNVSAFAQSYVFEGALADDVATAHTLGFALDISGAFAL